MGNEKETERQRELNQVKLSILEQKSPENQWTSIIRNWEWSLVVPRRDICFIVLFTQNEKQQNLWWIGLRCSYPSSTLVLHLQRYYSVCYALLLDLYVLLVSDNRCSLPLNCLHRSCRLPTSSGEKVTLGLTCFVAFSVFMLMVAEKVPATSDTVPIIGNVSRMDHDEWTGPLCSRYLFNHRHESDCK